ncbi:MAG TPA: hypothetical protein VFU88_06150 [Ktedonobacterales bacterium]|nr:hypothetical protein [Ktedonobacterales bacterium]
MMAETNRTQRTVRRRLIVLGRRWPVCVVGGCACLVVVAAVVLGIPVNGLLMGLAETVWLVSTVLFLLGGVTQIAELDVGLPPNELPGWLNRWMRILLWSLKLGGLIAFPAFVAAPFLFVFPDLHSSPLRLALVGLALIGIIPFMIAGVVALLMSLLAVVVGIPVGIVRARRRRREEALAYLDYLHQRPQ